MVEDGVDLSVNIRSEDVDEVSKVCDGDWMGSLEGEHVGDVPLVYEGGVDQPCLPQLPADEGDGAIFFSLIAVPENPLLVHLAADDGTHQVKHNGLGMGTVEP